MDTFFTQDKVQAMAFVTNFLQTLGHLLNCHTRLIKEKLFRKFCQIQEKTLVPQKRKILLTFQSSNFKVQLRTALSSLSESCIEMI